MRILLVCTGNVCRSPMAEGFLSSMAARRGFDLTVTSAGTVPGERTIDPAVLAVMGEDGLCLTDHVSRTLTARDLRQADLVLGMAREHVREAVVLEPSAWPKAFTLKEIVRRGEAAGPRLPGQPLEAWLASVGKGRTPDQLLGGSQADDVADPMGVSLPLLRATAEEIRDLVGRLLDLLAA